MAKRQGVAHGKAVADASGGEFARACRRMGQTAEQQSRWLLDFAHRDLAELTPADWLNLRWEMEAFLWAGEFAQEARVFGPPTQPLGVDVVRTCHEKLRKGLHRLVHDGKWEVRIPTSYRVAEWWGPPWRDSSSKPWWGGPRLRWVRRGPFRMTPGGPDSHFVTVEADPVGDFLVRVYETLKAEQHRFRVCELCLRPFIARKRQVYCTLRCSQRARTRRYRAQHPERARELRRAAYERKVRTKLGARVKVTRRPRASP